jgi:two-component system CheB/CheR fusion protein
MTRETPRDADHLEEITPAYTRLLEKLSAEHHFDFRSYKAGTLVRRIRARMSQVHVDGVEAYITFLDRHPSEAGALFNTILINITGFLRDSEAWKALGEYVIARLLTTAESTGTVRVWSAGCSTGEEAYSVAIMLAEQLGERRGSVDVKIYGTDLDEEALTVARHGLYRLEQLKELPPAFSDRYFAREGQLYRFRRDLRRWCIFGRHNLVQDPPLSHMDLVVCRNVLIYFKNDLQDRVIPRFHYALRGDGFLFLGRSESLLARSRWFTPVSARWRIFQRSAQPVARPAAALLRSESDSTAAGMKREPREVEEGGGVSMERLVEFLPFAVLVVDQDDVIRAWNRAAADLFDVAIDNVVGKRFRDLDISYRAEGLRARMEEVKGTRLPTRLENVAFPRRSGLQVHAEIRMTPLFDDRNRFIGVLVAAADVTEHALLRDEMARLTEQHATVTEELESTNEELETTNEELQSTNEELETTNEELQSTNEELLTTVDELQAATAETQRLALYHASVVHSVDQPLVVLDQAFRVTSWNPASEQLWGLAPASALGRDFFALPIGNVTAEASQAIHQIQASVPATDVLDVPFTAPGRDRPSVLRLAALKDAQDQLVGVVGRVLTDDWAPRPDERSGPVGGTGVS